MKILYSYITVEGEGSHVHIESFVRAFRALGEVLIERGTLERAYAGDKALWSGWRRVATRLAWIGVNVRHLFGVLRTARRERVDVIVFRFHPIHYFALAIVGAAFFYPVVLEINAVRSIENDSGRPRISDTLDRLCIARARRSFVVSRRMKEHLVKAYRVEESRIAVIPNGVDVEQFDPAIDGLPVRREYGLEHRLVIGFIGSFQPWHGVASIVSLAEALHRALPDVHFLLVGDGGARATYETMIQSKGLEAFFTFVGRVDHSKVPSYLAAMDILLAPVARGSFAGEFHGSPLKLFEYLAMARPVIAPASGQTGEIIEDGISGLLIDSNDTEKLAAAIKELAASPSRRKMLGNAGRQRVVAEFTWKANAERVRVVCRAAMEEA
jgi:glycosyltransferase involved in cell wall biosynthesis